MGGYENGDAQIGSRTLIGQFIELHADALVHATDNPRWPQIRQAVDFILEQHRADKSADLMFICTHNSRRSQFAHVWADVFAHHYGLDWVRCFSGGTEVTACDERTVAALRRAGFQITTTPGENPGENPTYWCKYAQEHAPIACSSSLWDTAGLEDFAAMICCADVDQRCPVVHGAAVRIALHYDDPKSSDGTDKEQACYDERCQQIGRDMLLLMYTVRTNMRIPTA